ncbi:MAG: hypothetical protein RLY31_223 [Bacteroidota bacterium]|jgi:glycosyltransferase involved in cell wall biosynthesis
MPLPQSPSISIVTVVFNGRQVIPVTVASVLSQTWSSLEYVVVDGGSSDGTVDYLRETLSDYTRSGGPISVRFVSEPDEGLYHAMNKGLHMASGEWILFLNAGDAFRQPDTLERMMRYRTEETDVLYGETMLVDSKRQPLGTRSETTTQRLPEQLDWKSLRFGMVVCHQAFLARRSLATEYIPDNLAADIDWIIQLLKRCRRAVHTHLVVVDYLIGGVSRQRHRQSLWDRFLVLQRHFGFFPNLMNHLLILLRAASHARRLR